MCIVGQAATHIRCVTQNCCALSSCPALCYTRVLDNSEGACRDCSHRCMWHDHTVLTHCRFREIVGKLKGMAQVLRPPPKRRPSQISSQASAGSSIPSLQAPGSVPNNNQLPNIAECAILAERKPPPSVTPFVSPAVSVPCAEASADPAAIGAAASAAVAETEASQRQSPETNDSDAPLRQGMPAEDTSAKALADKPEGSSEYVSPFEQAQGSVAPSAPQTDTPFADKS